MAKLKKIKINQLEVGMFIHEIDISWIHSPFLRHRRMIEKEKDILLLKKSGVKNIVINLQKGKDVTPPLKDPVDDELETQPEKPITNNGEDEEQVVPLSEEMIVAKQVQEQIHHLVSDIHEKIKNGEPVNVDSIKPIISDTLASLKRNDQALLSIIHMHRKDARLDSHAFGVFSIVLPLAIKCRLNSEEIEILGMSALLHDCGWSRLPTNLIGKGKAFTDSEKQLVQQHTNIAVKALKASNCVSDDVLQLVEQHHEDGNGTGYPNKLKEDKLHPLHNYLYVADLYDERIHGFDDQPGMLPANALKLIYKKSTEGAFPTLLAVEMLRIMGIYPISTIVQLTSGEIGIVREINRKLPLLPVVEILLDENMTPLNNAETINLSNDDETRLVMDVLDDTAIPANLIS